MGKVSSKEYAIDIRIAGILDKSLAKAVKDAKYQTASLNQQISAAAPLFNGMEKIATRAFVSAKVAAVALTKKTVECVKTVSELGMAFEKQMSAVSAITEGTQAEMKLITDRARQLGRETIYTAENIGQAMESMALSGWEAQEIYDGIAGVISLAAASGEDLTEMSNIMTDTLHAFNMEASKAEGVADVIAAAALNSNTNVTELGQALKYVGPIAGSLGYDLEDVSLALGLFANQGLKASQAGTGLRTILSKLMKGISVVGETTGEMNIEVANADGTLRPLIDIIYDLRTAFNKLSAAERGANAFEVGGIRGSTGLLALANASEEQVQSLYRTIENADYFNTAGTAAKTRLDNLAGDIELIQDAAKDLGLTIFYDINSPLRDVVQWATKLINKLNTKIKNGTVFDGVRKWLNGASGKNITVYLQNIVNIAKDLKEPVLNGLKMLASHLNDITGAIVGFCSAIAMYKAVSGIASLVKIFGMMGAGPLVGGITAAATAIGFLTSAFLKAKQKLAQDTDKSLADHFGDMTLSLEELQTVVNNFIGLERISDLERVSGAINDAATSFETLNTTAEALNKYKWKIDVGIKLDGEDYEDYGEQIKAFTEEATKYAQDQRYAVAVSMKLLFGDDSRVSAVGSDYVSAEAQLRYLGAEMSAAFNDAFVDGENGEGGIFNVNLLDTEKIAKLQSQMSEITSKMAQAESEAMLKGITRRNSGKSLTAESFMALMDEYATGTQEATDKYYEAYLQATTGINFSSMSEAEKNALETEAWKKYLEQRRGLVNNLWNYGNTTLNDTYGGLLTQGQTGLTTSIDKWLSHVFSQYNYSNITESPEIAQQLVESLTNGVAEYVDSGLSDADKNAIGKLLTALEPTYQQMAETKAQLEATGMVVPQSIENGIKNYEIYKAITGDKDSLMSLVGEAIGENDEWAAITQTAQDLSSNIPVTMGESMIASASADALKTAKAVKDIYQEAMQNQFEGLDVSIVLSSKVSSTTKGRYIANGGDLGSTTGYLLNNGYVDKSVTIGSLSKKPNIPTFTIPSNASGGIYSDPLLTTFAENGPEAAIPLDGSTRAVSLWKKAGDILSRKSSLADKINGSSGASITFAPNITINGNADRGTVLSALRQSQDEFNARMQLWLKNNSRVSFG